MKNNIKIKYYKQFQCIADKCPFSCCQEWKIGVDNHTYSKWLGKKLKGQTADLCHQVKRSPSGNYILLNQEKKCPFLNKEQLCKVVIEYGESYLSKTCTTFPRLVNEFEDRKEYALDPGCPAVIDLMKENRENTIIDKAFLEKKEDDILFIIRHMLIDIIQQMAYSLPERLMLSFYALLDLYEKEKLTPKDVYQIASAAYLEPIASAIHKMNFHLMDTIYENNELFLDVVENYRKQKLYTAYIEKLALFAEELEEKYSEEQILSNYRQFIILFKDYEALMRQDLMIEIFANVLIEGMTLEDMLIAFEWLSMTYVIMRQAIFLNWMLAKEQGKVQLDYEMVKTFIMLISRVTGYEQQDIREYMENSFEEAVWEWGYQALIIGDEVM